MSSAARPSFRPDRDRSFRDRRDQPFRTQTIFRSSSARNRQSRSPRNDDFHQLGMIIFMARNPHLSRECRIRRHRRAPPPSSIRIRSGRGMRTKSRSCFVLGWLASLASQVFPLGSGQPHRVPRLQRRYNHRGSRRNGEAQDPLWINARREWATSLNRRRLRL